MSETAKHHNGRLTSGRLLARNTLWNLVGTAAPVASRGLAVPYLIPRMRTDRFGVLGVWRGPFLSSKGTAFEKRDAAGTIKRILGGVQGVTAWEGVAVSVNREPEA